LVRRHDSLLYVTENLGVLLLYYAAGRLGLALAIEHPSVSLVWPPSGIALAALVLLGYPSWPTIFLGAFLVNITVSGSVTTSLSIAGGNTLESLLGAWLVTRYAGGRRAFDEPRGVLLFAILAAGLSTMVSATLGAASLLLGDPAARGTFPRLWTSWWLGDAVGVLVVAPLLILWAERPRARWDGRGVEGGFLLATLAGAGIAVFSNRLPGLPGGAALGVFAAVPLLWAALRFTQRETATAAFLFSAIAVRATILGLDARAAGARTDALIVVQSALGALALLALAVAAHVARAKRIERDLDGAREDLEMKIQERTAALLVVNADLRKSESRFRDFLESAPDPLLIVDGRGRIVLVNAQAEKTFGYGRQELIGHAVEALLPERFGDRHVEARAAYFQAARARPMGEGMELFARRKDGTEFPVDIALSPIETDRGLLVSASIRDISRRKQGEETVARLAAVVASSEDAIISTDADGFIATWNAAAERILGYPAGEAIGRPSAILSAPTRTGEMEEILERLKRREQVRYETEVLRRDGTVIEVAITAFPVIDRAGRVIGFSTMFRDITEQKRGAAAAREQETLKSQVDDLSRHTHEIKLLSELGEVLRAAVRLSEAYPVIPRFLHDLFPAESGGLYEFDETHQLFGTVLTWGDQPPQEIAFAPDECWGMRRARMHAVEGPDGEMICQHQRPPIHPGSLCIPLMARGKTLGLLHLGGVPNGRRRMEHAGALSEYRLRLAKTVAQQISSALFDLRLQETLRDQASRDPLTGLFNRRYMEETLHRELFRAARKKTQVGFVLFDLDHFKRFNDRFGHAAGDAVLRDVSAFLKRHSRAEDVLCRYGGEEFLLVLTDCSPKNALKRAESIRVGVRELRLEHEQRPLGEMTLSVGVALFPDHGQTLEDLFQVADAALYQAKKQGRDRVVVAEAIPWVMAPPRSPGKETQH
jgi:diguanylate cyclase (GGDEF)-like protein/PAS domain S-box-containing protein